MKTKYYINEIEVSCNDFYAELKCLNILFYSIEDVSNENGFNHRYLYL